MIGRADQEADQPFTTRWPTSLAGSAPRSLRDSSPGPGLAVRDCQWQLEQGPGRRGLVKPASLAGSDHCSALVARAECG